MYLYVFGMFWYVLYVGLAHGFGASTGGIGTYYGMYSYVFKGKHVMIPINTGTW